MADRPEQQNGHELTPPSAWREQTEQGVLIRLISGNIARIRPVNVDTFIQSGHIPDHLTPLVEQMFVTGATKMPDGESVTKEKYLDYQTVADAFCKTCFIFPEVVDEVTDEDRQITPAMISDADKGDLLSYMGRPAAELARFHPLEENALDDLYGEPLDKASAESTTES